MKEEAANSPHCLAVLPVDPVSHTSAQAAVKQQDVRPDIEPDVKPNIATLNMTTHPAIPLLVPDHSCGNSALDPIIYVDSDEEEEGDDGAPLEEEIAGSGQDIEAQFENNHASPAKGRKRKGKKWRPLLKCASMYRQPRTVVLTDFVGSATYQVRCIHPCAARGYEAGLAFREYLLLAD